ncbi:LysR family transcriptional regulator [Pseudoramibacter sp.]|jgi:DNA-binding transcriptional LysR family regulator|uniref:LysR family transcriptional regulator n=1 Tax=Pseudoramibacter sp. TaxID=2034862 RepID=UPI0025E621D2|nr:LysR family transcriptional regulator [Pseudoramibacter sp.]MCH4071799.1 LysR family transcriptional regulator [Pseudoramibacter sp.]MCH4105567.1 LysR family transcriptional regulator [Pseudoramibacter sp.]
MDGNLKKYEAFVKTAEAGSFSDAAKTLHYAQSSVSKMIGDLEKAWGLRLLERSRSGVRLTPSGEQILAQYRMHPKIRLTTWEDYAIMAMVEKGLGTAILPKLILQRCPYKIAVRSFTQPYYRDIGLVFRDRETLSPAARRLADAVRTWVKAH